MVTSVRPDGPGARDLRPITEDEIIKILNKEDDERGQEPVMSHAEFLAELYKIVDVLNNENFAGTGKTAEILRLRARRIGKDGKYAKSAVRANHYNKRMFALTEDEQIKVLGSTVGIFLFPLREILQLPVGRWKKKGQHKIKYAKKGRPSNAARKAMEERLERERELIAG